MKTILVLANNDVGLYKFRKELLQALIEKGNKVYIALPYGKLVEPLIQMGCKFINTNLERRGINPITDFKLLLQYKKIIEHVKPDLVLTYTIKPNIYGGLISRLIKIPYIANITGLGTAFQREDMLKKFIVGLYKAALGNVKSVFFENQGNKQVFLDNHIIGEEVAVVMNGAGVNLEEYPFTSMPEGDTIRFLFIGRVMKEKGVDELFAAAKKIKKEYNNVEFDIVGPFEEDYESIVRELQDRGIINYYGYQEDVRPFIEKCHCVVLPSYHEGMANTLLEAAAMGRPLIASNIHGCKEAVYNNGFVCEIKNTESIYLKIVEYINTCLEDKVRMGENSRKHIEIEFDKKKVVKRSMNIIYCELKDKNVIRYGELKGIGEEND